MSQEVIETKDGLKVRKLVDLRPSTAKEYQEAIIKRVDYFSQKRDSAFNNMAENVIVQALKIGLQAKVKLDELLGDNTEKIKDFVEQILFIGL